jgi:hypothetical protein
LQRSRCEKYFDMYEFKSSLQVRDTSMHVEGPTSYVSHLVDESNQLCVFLSKTAVLGVASSISEIFYEICL